MQPGDLLVEVLGQHVDADGVLLGLGEELDLGQHLVGEGVRHHEDGWPVALPRFISRPSDSTMIALPVAGKVHRSTCGLTFLRGRRRRTSRGRPCRSRCRSGRCCRGSRCASSAAICSTVTTSLLPVAVMMMSATSSTSSRRGDLVAVHGGLQRADRVDLGDDDAGALAAQRLGAALADVAVAADDRDLAADQDVGGAVDAVDQRVAAAVLVVELATW